MPRQCAVLANPGAGSYSESLIRSYLARLTTAGIHTTLHPGTDFSELTELAQNLSRQPDPPLIVAAGGDGTINAVYNGLAGANATCALIPCGTANVLARELAINNADQALAHIIAGHTRPLSAGLLTTHQGASRFFLMTGIGIDGQIVRGVSLKDKRRFGKGAYLLSALRCIKSWETSTLQVSTPEQRFTCHSIIICNAARYGGSFKLAPTANLFSPTLEVIALKTPTRRAFLKLAMGLLRSQPQSSTDPDILRFSTTKLRIAGSQPLQADGDDRGNSPADIAIEPEYARIITGA